MDSNLGKIVEHMSRSSAKPERCEKCGFNLKYRDATSVRKWCKRCINVYYRKINMTAETAEEIIIRQVEPLYADACLQNVDEPIRQRLLRLVDGQDVFICGPPGVGKTYCFAALIRHYVYEGFECLRISFDDFCVLLRSAMSAAARLTEWDIIKPLKCVDKLFIDDLGLRGKPESDFAYTTLYSILNKRQERLLATFISSNKDIERLELAFDSRIASRLRAAIIIEMKGQDKRIHPLSLVHKERI